MRYIFHYNHSEVKKYFVSILEMKLESKNFEIYIENESISIEL